MIAFHGSPHLFEHFELPRADSCVRVAGSTEGRGIYLTTDRAYATTYAAYADGNWRIGDSGGYLYEVSAPDGAYLDTERLISEQPEPARTVLSEAFSRFDTLRFPQKNYWKFRIETMAEAPIHTQVGLLLMGCFKGGLFVEPDLIAAGYVGCKRSREDGADEYVVFDPAQVQILSVAALLEERAALLSGAF
ncbi:hypothetical protein [Mesorhizobium sp. M0129]|uniref:hypothetical protein n=1 Tax=Mesorhizobium sp. M0129 TaxID=2956886 RepID=UPI00333B9DE2